MMMASDLSMREGWIEASDVERLQKLLQQANLPVAGPPDLSAERYLDIMSVDKKAEAGQIRFVLQKAIGDAIVTDQFSPQKLQETLSHCRQP
jgi:3-dehydroquinate synthase